MDYIALAIPAFFAFMGLEWAVARARGLEVYRFADWVANLGCGIVQQTFKLVLALFTFVGYRWIHENHRLAELDASAWWVWVLCFLGVDLAYYWFHRLSHQINFLWSAHVVHHQSEEYNLGVALRQSAFQGAFSWPFYLPLALWFPPVVFGANLALNTLYQFWIHTRLIGRLGWLEYVLNTPSHHRVHHGQNRQYIDRNHAGTLIIWDKLFGTFEPEGEAVVYGVTEPPLSWNPVFANFHHLGLSWRRMRAARRWQDKIGVWWRRPGFVPEGATDAGKRTDPLDKYDPPVGRALVTYVGGQLAFLALGTTLYLLLRQGMDPPSLLLGGAAIILSAGLLGALLDGRPWAWPLERARPFALAGVVAALGWTSVPMAPAVWAAGVGWVALSAWGLRRAARRPAGGDLGPPT